LIDAIISQQLSVKAGDTILRRFQALFGGRMPTPQEILATSTDTIRSIGASRAKAAYIKDLAEHISDGRLDLDHLSTLPNEEIIRELTAVKGLGVWSAHMFLIFSVGRLDILPVGDLGIRRAVMQLYGLPAMPAAAAIEAIAQKNDWHPYESVASWYLWRSLENS
jgi:DNA-3-methyladenine glycosylase II